MTGLARDRKSIGASIDGISQLVGATVRPAARGAGAADEHQRPASAPWPRMFRRPGTTLEDGAARRSATSSSPSAARASYENAVNVYLCTIAIAVGEPDINLAGNDGPWSEVCR